VSRLRDESGFTVIELAIAATISLIVLGATLAVFEGLIHQRDTIERQTEVETMARQGTDRLARQLRNLASPADVITAVASTQPKAVDRNLPNDLIFKDIADVKPTGSSNSANVRRVRYCLQTSGAISGQAASASASRGLLWMQLQTWTTAAAPAMPADTACPGAGWASQLLIADHVVNAAQSPASAIFRYSGDAGLVTATDDASREQISRVETTLLVDPDPIRMPRATQLTSSVTLRNQNRVPIPRFTYTLLNPLTCSVQLNGSASEDPESKPLEYEWYVDGVKRDERGVVVHMSLSMTPHTYQLKVRDRAGLVGTSPVETHLC
jgi:type II secretory pathway component PulJ